MKYFNTLIVEKTQESIEKYEEILVNKPVPWYGHTLTNSSDEPFVFSDQQTYMSISIIPGNVFLGIWVDANNLFNISLNLDSCDDNEKDESYLVLSNVGELHNNEGEDYINTLTEKLESLASKLKHTATLDNLNSIVLIDEPQQGLKINFVLENTKILLKMLFNGKETLIEEFDTEEKVAAYISVLNKAKEEAM